MSSIEPFAASNARRHAPKVVFINRYFFPDRSATSQLLSDLVFALARSGFEIHVVCSRQRYDEPRARLEPRETVAAVSVQRVWTTRFGRDGLAGRALDYLTFYASSALALGACLGRGDIVIAETDPPLISLVAMAVARLKGAHLINWLQDLFPEVASVLGMSPLPPRLDGMLRSLRNRSLRAAVMNVVLGERMRRRLTHLGVPDQRITVVENWAEVDPPAPKPVEDSALRAALGLSGRFIVGYAGNLGRAHDYHTVLAAAEILKPEAGIVFLMVGGGAGMNRLRASVEERRLDNFRFVPYQPREGLADALAAADVHWVSLLPALEGLIVPSKFYGIIAAARPVIFIGDADGELAREIAACECGAHVGIGEATELARILMLWRADAPRRVRLGDNGRRRYDERFAGGRAFAAWGRILTRTTLAAAASSPSP